MVPVLQPRTPLVWPPIALSADGSSVYVQTISPTFLGIAMESLPSGAIVYRIRQEPPGYTGAQGGLGRGGVLVWTSTYSTHGGAAGAMTPVLEWSPRTGRVTKPGPAGSRGAPLSAPVFGLGGRLVAWETADGRRQEIVEANLVSGTARVVGTGRLGPPVFVGSALVWFTATGPDGRPGHLVAVNAAALPALRPVAVPVSVRAASDPVVTGSPGNWVPASSLIAVSGGAIAYVSSDLTKLYYSPSPSAPAKLVTRLSGPGATFTPGGLFVGPGYIAWETASAGSYLASTSSFAVKKVIDETRTWGLLDGSGNNVLVVTSPPSKKSHLLRYHLVSGSTISALRCARE
jgi:hypothetical protein